MKKTLTLPLLATAFLFACGEDTPKVKDAAYYYNHTDETMKVIADCKKQQDEVTLENFKQLETNQTCIDAHIAAAGIKMGSLDAGKVDNAELWRNSLVLTEQTLKVLKKSATERKQ